MFQFDQVSRPPYLAPVSLQVSAVEVVTIQGSSGVGKSVLLRALADLDSHQGKVRLFQQTQTKTPPEQWRRQVMWFGAETAWWLPTVLAHFEAVYHWRNENLKQKAEKKPADCQNSQSCPELKAYLAEVGLEVSILNQPIWQLSSGEKQRLALIRGLLLEPKVLLLDEVTANCDPDSTLKVEALVKRYVKQGGVSRCALWVTHDPAQAERVAHRSFRLTQQGLESLS
jgi:ABC-type iron transport system FetAB ATPase subunit